jgi:hypothetical protein
MHQEVKVKNPTHQEVHLGHPRVTVARQSDLALFTLGLNLAKSTSLYHAKKGGQSQPLNSPR